MVVLASQARGWGFYSHGCSIGGGGGNFLIFDKFLLPTAILQQKNQLRSASFYWSHSVIELKIWHQVSSVFDSIDENGGRL